MGSPLMGSVTGLLGLAIGISPAAVALLPPLDAAPGFPQAARIAARLGSATAEPPARRRKSRRLIGCERRGADIERIASLVALSPIYRRFKPLAASYHSGIDWRKAPLPIRWLDAVSMEAS